MKIQKGKWYVCIEHWSDDGWCKFYKGTLLLCEKDDELKDIYGYSHQFNKDEAEKIFREATELERSIASGTEVNIDDVIKNISYFEPTQTIIEIYRMGAEKMLKFIRANLHVKGKED